VALRRFDHPPGADLTDSEEQASEQFQVNFVERGCFRFGFRSGRHSLASGSIFLSRPGEVYTYAHIRDLEPDTCLSLEFSASFSDDLPEILHNVSPVLPGTNRLAFLQMRLCSTAQPEMSLDIVAAELLEAVHSNGNDSHQLYRPERLKWYARKVIAAREFMDADPTGQHSLLHLSKQVAMSPFLFARVFRELTGVAPHKYLVLLRLQRARTLLESGMSVTETCYAVGFNNLSHFIRSFQGYFGVLPSVLKRSKSTWRAECPPRGMH
jgi:AraC-like DNA-binding protein